MFLGHYGAALALKRAEPKLSLGTVFLAAQLLDLLWGAFLILGWEHASIPGPGAITPIEFTDYPISHSLVGAIAWAIAAAAVYYSWPTRDTVRHWQAAAIVGLAVFSHYPIDILVHLRDLPIAGNDSLKLGLGLWRYPRLTMAAELITLGLGLTVYLVKRTRRHPVRPVRLGILMAALIGIYLLSVYSPPPTSMTPLGIGAIGIIVVAAALAAWADRRPGPAQQPNPR
jgi:hypothetical protein